MEVDQFAEAVQNTTDPGLLAEAFHEAVRKQAVDLNKSQGRSPEFAALERETRLWSLVETVRASAGGPAADQHGRLLAWFQEMQVPPAEPKELAATKWLHTATEVRAGQAAVRALDPDAPVREGAAIAAADREADRTVFGYIFELLLAGQRERAARVCTATTNWQLRALIEAPVTPLGAATCYAVASTPNTSEEERAVYGLLAGDAATTLPLCRTWEQQFIAMLNCLVRCDQFNGAATKLALPACPYTSLDDIFGALAASPADFVHRVMAAVVAGRVGEFAEAVAHEIDLVAAQETQVVADPASVRITAHLVMLAPETVAPAAFETVLDAYIGYLEMLEKWHWIPGYVRFLPHDALVRVYGRGLAQIASEPQRQLQLQLAARFALPVAECVRAAVELVLKQNAALFVADEPGEPALSAPPTEAGQQLVSAVEWLRDAQLWEDAATTATEIVRTLLLSGDVGALRRLGQSVSLVELAEQGSAPELRQYDILLRALNAIASYDAGEPERVETAELAKIVAQTAVAAAEFMSPEAVSALPAKATLETLRAQYVPLVILESLRVLRAAQEFERALEMAVLVADERNRLYSLFAAKGRLPELLDGLARAELGNW